MNNFTHKVYLMTEDNASYRDLLNAAMLPDLDITEDTNLATILLASPTQAADKISQFPQIEWIQSIYAGVDALVPFVAPNCILTNVKGIFGQPIAEYVLGYLIQYQRHHLYYHDAQQHAEWRPKPYKPLSSLCMLILGTGSVGSHLALSAKTMGMKVIGINRSGIPPLNSAFDETFHIQELDSVIGQVDVLVNTLPSTRDTDLLLNGESLSKCQSALLFNVGRGNALCENSLLKALNDGNIKHAFLDVFKQEPLPPEHFAWKNPAITITPHIAGLSFPPQVVDIFTDNYHRWRDGFALLNEIDVDQGY
ncbi:D-2-hydroxyacid dehydrogenase [Vibrio ostreicida]|uniref:D-2-hydroxyacid dehydrogenase n=1 Tax=Vibrio ostreicida TaxID=526588 RepID=UPI000970A11D|nr:D-2-hydroxyacid dehydrogenase [Vibrio ostreicida]